MRRMDRYKDSNSELPRRYEKNQELYHDVANNTKYTNIVDVKNANAYEIDNSKKTYSSREDYQRLRAYRDVEAKPKVKKELDDFNFLYKDQEKKIYDINSVLEEARKNRQEKDSLEDKRRLKNTSYNILADLNKEELEKYREEKKKRIMTPEEQEFHDMVDTIASKTLAGEIDKATSINLLSDLMATSVMDKVDDAKTLGDKEETQPQPDEVLSKTQISEVVEKDNELKDTPKALEGADSDFYTRSMDLSDKDFEVDDEFKEKGLPLPVKILITLIIIAIIAVAAYFIYKRLV